MHCKYAKCLRILTCSHSAWFKIPITLNWFVLHCWCFDVHVMEMYALNFILGCLTLCNYTVQSNTVLLLYSVVLLVCWSLQQSFSNHCIGMVHILFRRDFGVWTKFNLNSLYFSVRYDQVLLCYGFHKLQHF